MLFFHLIPSLCLSLSVCAFSSIATVCYCFKWIGGVERKKRRVTAEITEKRVKRGHFYCHESEIVLLNNTLNIYQGIWKSGVWVCVRLLFRMANIKYSIEM